VWLEVVFIEWSRASYSVYVRTGEAVPGLAESPGLLPRTPGRLSWRKVLRFVQSNDLTAISERDPQPIDIRGVEPWQREVLLAAMLRLSIVPLLAKIPEEELGALYDRLGGFLSTESLGQLRRLTLATASPLFARKSLAKIAQLVGSSDPLDTTRLAEDCAAYVADRHAEKVLAQHGDTPVPPSELFLSLSRCDQPRSSRLRAGLFELWLRTDPKPKGGMMSVGCMDDELPVLHWLLRKRVAAIFEVLIENRRPELEQFVAWFLGKALYYTRYFTGGYRFDSFVVYAYGRPRFALWARLGKEVQDAALSLGIPIPEEVRLPAMPSLDKPTRAFSFTSPVRITARQVEKLRGKLSEGEAGESDGDS
jgi:hypothetical protein